MHALYYIVIKYMKKTKANILCMTFAHYRNNMTYFLVLLIPTNPQKKTISINDNIPKAAETKEVHRVEIKISINATSIGAYLKSQVPPFYLHMIFLISMYTIP
jgi:hypothetical protein